MAKSKHESKKMKLSKNLTPEQIAQYKRIGRPNMSQNWLELFTNELVTDLFTIMRSCSDNQKKAVYIEQELEPLGFRTVGEGTNILVMSNPVYPGVVYKIALDDNGIADNFNDCILQDIVPRYVPVFARHPSSIVTVQQRGVKPTTEQMDRYRPKILGLLKELSKYFLVADLSPDMFLNYVVDRDGKFLICDGSDLYPLHQIKNPVRCKRIVGEDRKTGDFKYCEGKLKYSEDFKWLICEKCGKEYNPLELRPKKEVKKVYKVMSDGFSVEEQRTLESQEIEAVMRKHGIKVEPEDHVDEGPAVVDIEDLMPTADESSYDGREEPRTVFVDPEDDEDEDSIPENNDGSMDETISDEDLGETESDPINNPDINDEDDDYSHVTYAHPLQSVGFVPEDSTDDPKTDEDGESEETEVSKVIVIEETARTNKLFITEGNHMEITKPNVADPVELMESLKRRDVFAFSEKVNAIMIMAGMTPTHDPEIDMDADKRPIDVVISQLKDGEIFGEDLDELKSLLQSENNNTSIASGSELPIGSHIRYQLVYEDDDPTRPSGIVLYITGDFDEAYDEYGLPIYVNVDGVTDVKAISAFELKKLMTPAVKDACDEYQSILSQKAYQPQDDDDEA